MQVFCVLPIKLNLLVRIRLYFFSWSTVLHHDFSDNSQRSKDTESLFCSFNLYLDLCALLSINNLSFRTWNEVPLLHSQVKKQNDFSQKGQINSISNLNSALCTTMMNIFLDSQNVVNTFNFFMLSLATSFNLDKHSTHSAQISIAALHAKGSIGVCE